MDKRAVLEKAIRLAIDGGWKSDVNDLPDASVLTYTAFITGRVFDLIYNQSFAKALWGHKEFDAFLDKVSAIEKKDMSELKPWKRHLQQMVIADDPIKYLGENI